ncbi:hypothetical protein MESS2_10010 [Mesorhizobium metallidurans STM 2683]|uniref:Uncharacterized protein n=1 Tax=Mesorhizobium metallidurans STM 2683 TaxID=1297569 RepID=M5EE55_9HYPH|nr:hypothetical protein MESS2_10010 [Mesorhizobium metallidurans STM 2683]
MPRVDHRLSQGVATCSQQADVATEALSVMTMDGSGHDFALGHLRTVGRPSFISSSFTLRARHASTMSSRQSIVRSLPHKIPCSHVTKRSARSSVGQ